MGMVASMASVISMIATPQSPMLCMCRQSIVDPTRVLVHRHLCPVAFMPHFSSTFTQQTGSPFIKPPLRVFLAVRAVRVIKLYAAQVR